MYAVMRCPSACWATSSGIAMLSMRESTHPTFPSRMRTRDQSSTTAGAGAATAGFGFVPKSETRGRESWIQLVGGAGGVGMGGASTVFLPVVFFLAAGDGVLRIAGAGAGATG